MLQRTPLKPVRQAFALGVVLATQTLIASPSIAAPTDYSGHWMYQQTCDWQHVATLDLEQTGSTVTGTWSDGTRVRGSEGSLKGELVNGTLYVRFCGIDESSGYAVCPKFDSEITDHFIKRGSALVWYQGSGKGFDEYLVLHTATPGKAFAKDSNCSREAW